MANIPLAEIPNAPSAVFTPVADPRYQGDVVGDQAKAEIKQGYQASMVNPEQAGAMGRGITQLGEGIGRGGEGVATGMILMDAADRREKLRQDTMTGLPKLYQNQATILNTQSQLMQGQDPQMAPSMWLKAAGDKGENFLQGMTPGEQEAMQIHAIHEWGQGLIQNSQSANNQHHLDILTAVNTTYNDLVKGERYDDAIKHTNACADSKLISPKEKQVWLNGIQTSQQFSGLRDKLAYAFGNVRATSILPQDQQSDESSLSNEQSKNLLQSVRDAIGKGTSLPGYEKLGSKDLKTALNVGEYIDASNVAAAQQSALKRVESGSKLSPDDLSKLPEWGQMDEKAQQAVHDRLTNINYNTPEGKLARSQALTSVQNFPSTDDPLKEATDIRNYAVANLPDDKEMNDVLGQLDSKIKEMAGNGGKLNEDSQTKQFSSQYVTAMLHAGNFGKFNPEIVNNPKGKQFTPEEVANALKSSLVAKDILKKVDQANPQSPSDAKNIIDQETRVIRAGNNVSPGIFQKTWNSLFGPKPSTPEKFQSNNSIKQANNDGWNTGTTTWFGTSPDGKPDPEDNGNGKYAGTKTADPKYQGASISEAELKAHGIDPENHDQVAKHEIEVKYGDQIARVPIADKGPAKWVENRQGTTVDLTGAVHRALGINSEKYKHGAPIQWRIVPKDSNA